MNNADKELTLVEAAWGIINCRKRHCPAAAEEIAEGAISFSFSKYAKDFAAYDAWVNEGGDEVNSYFQEIYEEYDEICSSSPIAANDDILRFSFSTAANDIAAYDSWVAAGGDEVDAYFRGHAANDEYIDTLYDRNQNSN